MIRKLLVTLLSLSAIAFAQATSTPKMGFSMPGVGQQSWQQSWYNNFNLLDGLLSGSQALPYGLMINTPGTQPACNAASRGLIWNVLGSTDVFETCRFYAGTYSWQLMSGGYPASGTASYAATTNVIAGDSAGQEACFDGNHNLTNVACTPAGFTWGSITGTLSLQTDLASALNAKVANTTTVNGHALSANVTVSASDLTTGTLPLAQVPSGIPTSLLAGANTGVTSILPSPLASSALTAQNSSIGATNLLSSVTAGFYRLILYADENTGCTTGSNSVTFTVNWTDATQARSFTTSSLTLGAQSASAFVSTDLNVWLGSGSVTYSSTVTGSCGTGSSSYDVHVQATRLQ